MTEHRLTLTYTICCTPSSKVNVSTKATMNKQSVLELLHSFSNRRSIRKARSQVAFWLASGTVGFSGQWGSVDHGAVEVRFGGRIWGSD